MVAQRIASTGKNLPRQRAGIRGYLREREGTRNGTTRPVLLEHGETASAKAFSAHEELAVSPTGSPSEIPEDRPGHVRTWMPAQSGSAVRARFGRRHRSSWRRGCDRGPYADPSSPAER